MPWPFEALLASAAAAHGHLCPGQVVGVRMALLGCRLIGLKCPCGPEELAKLIVYVEMDRCTADAVAHVTGVKLGRRSLKYLDYGIMAATFLNLETGQAFRIISREEARALAGSYAPEVSDKLNRQIAAYKRMPESVLFRVQKVRLKINDLDLPGPTRRRVACAKCGQMVRDGRERVVKGRVLCRICAEGGYFSDAQELAAWEEMPWAPEQTGIPEALAAGGAGRPRRTVPGDSNG
jgi:formylmethanofuran dehydrogenase subunit E